MEIALDPALDAALKERARKESIKPEEVVLKLLRAQLLSGTPEVRPQDEWGRRLLEAAIDCGVSLSDEAVSSEGIYE